MGYFPTTHAIMGAMADKDLVPMLARVNPLIDRWYFTDLPTSRAARATDLKAQWQLHNTRQGAFAHAFASPVLALQAALAAADPADRIVVFGSFYTVGGVLQHGVPRAQAKHLSS
jgi:dihydrofolate synthase/folylpolyglutamate synthase